MKTNDQLEPNVFVIFGGAGDLTWRKLVPALFDLSQDRSIPADYSVIAVDRVDLSDQKLRRRLHDGVKQFSRQGNVKAGEWNEFASHIHYQQGDFKKLQTYAALGEQCAKLEKEAFAVRSPDAYETLLWDVMKNDATLFMRADQVEAAWRLLTPVLEAWAVTPPSDFPNYAAGTWGPEDAQGLLAQGHSWPLPTELVELPLNKGKNL